MKFLKIFFGFVVCPGILLLAGCASQSKAVKPSAQANSLQSLAKEHQLQTQWDAVAQSLTIYYHGQRIDVLVGSTLVLKNGRRISLAQAVGRQKDVILFPADFVSKVLVVTPDVPVEPTEYISGRFREIMIDAGHGGKDPGAISRRGVREKDIVLDISQRLKENLEQKGIKVRMTRDSDEFISLEERTRMASRSKVDFFISIHANSSRNKKVQGIEIYYSRESLGADPEAQQKENLQTMANVLNIKSDRPVVKDIVMDMMLATKSAESREFGQSVIRHVSRAIDTPNRGSRSCRFFVVRNTLMPAVLIEVGYLTNHKEEQALNSAAYRQKIADAITESILNYANDS